MSAPRASPGAVVGGDFEIVRALSEGGMGAVYVVRQRSTGALRALKLMHSQFVGDEGMRRRFAQKARAAAAIDSDYVVDVLSAGVDDASGVPWIAMELLEGEHLGEHIGRLGRRSPGEALEILRMLCHAVAAAHDVGIVHRDLKPENVFLARPRRPGEPFTVKVLDFGIARATTGVHAAATAAIGSPLWMAPEQTARGDAIAPATDVWALGLVAFYLLAGRWYWRTPDDASASVGELLRELTQDPLEAASARAEAVGAGPLPPGFDAWFARCVTRVVAGRFPNARAAFAALEPVLAGAAGSTREDGGAGRTIAVASPAPQRGQAFFVGPGVERALAAGPLLWRPPGGGAAPGPLPQTGPATSVTAPPAEDRGAGTASPWVPVLVVAAIVGAAGGWLLSRAGRATPEVAPSAPVEAVSSMSAVRTAPSPLPAPDAAGDEPRAVADASPMVSFAGAVFEVGYAAGAVDERPVHPVSFTTFFLEVDEVTVARYGRCVTAGRCAPPGDGDLCTSGHPGRANNPVSCVSLAQAEAYCGWLGRRLPTEEEWEYAAGGAAKRLYAWGNVMKPGHACMGRPDAGPCDVGTFDAGATPEGLRDLTGNVWEWTASDYCPYDGSSCARDQKVARGGGWFSADANVVRTQVRQGYPPASQSANVGFRCAKSL